MNSLALYRYQLPFTQPLTFNGQVEAVRQGLLVRIGNGWGEIAPLPGFSRETLAEAATEAIACLTAIAHGATPVPRLPSVQFGLDCAVRHWPTLTARLPDPYLLIQGAPRQLLDQLNMLNQSNQRNQLDQWFTSGRPNKLKLKVARHPLQDELALIHFLCERLPAVKLVLDANQGWTRDEACTFCRQLDPARIDYLEEPCREFTDTAFVARHTGIAVALDEVLAQGQDWQPIPHLKALILKPTLLGSLQRCEALVTRARELQLQVIVSSSFESALGLGQLARLAAEWAPRQAPGLDTHRWVAGDYLLDEYGQPIPELLEPLYCNRLVDRL
jgi:O-succinylbenzoate synthase